MKNHTQQQWGKIDLLIFCRFIIIIHYESEESSNQSIVIYLLQRIFGWIELKKLEIKKKVSKKKCATVQRKKNYEHWNLCLCVCVFQTNIHREWPHTTKTWIRKKKLSLYHHYNYSIWMNCLPTYLPTNQPLNNHQRQISNTGKVCNLFDYFYFYFHFNRPGWCFHLISKRKKNCLLVHCRCRFGCRSSGFFQCKFDNSNDDVAR